MIERVIPTPTCGCCGGPRSIYSAAWCKGCYSLKSRPTQFKPVHTSGVNYEQMVIILAEIAARDERDAHRDELRQFRNQERREKAEMLARYKNAKDLAKARRMAPTPASLSYPYISVVTDDHSDLMLVNSIVPRGMEGREDVCQEIMVALWEKHLSIDDIRAKKGSIRAFLTAFRRENFENGGYAVSLDEPRRDGRSWHDVLVASSLENYL